MQTTTLDGMDVRRTKKPARTRAVLAIAGAVLAVCAVTFALSRLSAALPSVQRSALWVDTVKRGDLMREVRGPGTLVPEQIRYVSAAWPARVEAIRVKPGERVEADTVLLELNNPELELQALEAERQLSGARSALVELLTSGEGTQLQLLSGLETLRSDARDARRVADANARLADRGLVSSQEQQKGADKQAELDGRLELERRRQSLLKQGLDRQVAAQREQLQRLEAVAAFRRRQVEGLKVRAGEAGVLQELPLQPGQWVSAGTLLAKVAQPEKLKAEVRISEVQARDVAVGQRAKVDTRQGIVEGTVSRVDPSVQSGAVKVEIVLMGALPKGARPDLSVEGTIELERLEHVLYVGRPAFVLQEGPANLYRVSAGVAERVPVVLGRGSTAQVQVVQGLTEGDEVILSDMSQLDSHERLALK